MNSVNLIGNIGQDLKTTELVDNKKYIYFNIAVNDGKKTNWIKCIAWNNTADFILKYFSKGSRIGITGKLKSDTYEKDNKKIYSMIVVVQNVSFAGSKNQDNEESNTNDEFTEIEEQELNNIDVFTEE